MCTARVSLTELLRECCRALQFGRISEADFYQAAAEIQHLQLAAGYPDLFPWL